MNIKKSIFLLAFSGVLLASCNNNDSESIKGDYDNGILVANEGVFPFGEPTGTETGTVNFISENYLIAETTIFNKVNNESVGVVLQSIGFKGDDAYLIANVSNKITIADRYTMEKITAITEGLSNPRYIAFANGKGYVTNWGDAYDTTDDYVAVVDLDSNTISATIAVSEGPEQIIANGNMLYVSHKGGWGSGNSISVINASSDTLESTITVGDIPDEMAINNSGNLLVSCEGVAATSWNPTEVLGSLVTINTNSNEVISTLDFTTGFHPNTMVLSDSNLYLSTSSDVYKMSESATEIPTESIISTTVSTMAVNDDKVYVTDVKDYVSNGSLKVFDETTGTELKEFTVGIIPGKIYFN